MMKECLFFKTGNPIINNYDFYKRFGTLYDLFYDLISKTKSIKKAAKVQSQIIIKIEELRNFVLSEEKSINEKESKGAIKKTKKKTPKKTILTTQKSVLNNALKLYDRKTTMINAFINKSIYLGDLEDVYQDKEPKFVESIAERTKMRRQKQEARGLKILTSQQMLSRPPISLAQLKAGNNSQKLKNEIRQLMHSLYR